MRKIVIYVCGLFMVLAAFACVQKDNVNLEWKKEGQGIWKISVGKQEKVTLLSELDITPQWKAIEEIGDAPLAIDPKDVKTEVVDGKTYIWSWSEFQNGRTTRQSYAPACRSLWRK